MLYFLFLPLLFSAAYASPVPDYENPYAPIYTDKPVYTWTDKVKVTIVAPSWNTDRHLIDSIGGTDEHPVKISSSEHTLEPYRFTETDANSGIFTAEVILTGFSHDVDGDGDPDTMPRTLGSGPADGFLQVDRDSAITISFEFADGVVLVESVPTSWNVAAVNFTDDVLYLKDPVTVRVIDADMNLDPETLDSVQVQVFSDSDAAGIIVRAVETSESSGAFVAHVSLTADFASSGNRLHSLHGDEIFAKYDDYTLPKPYSESDVLVIQTSASVDSPTLPIKRIANLPIVFSDKYGNHLDSLSKDSQSEIVVELANRMDFKQNFICYIQVKDDKDTIQSVSFVRGEIHAHQHLTFSKSWIPGKVGTFTVETFVWDSLNDNVAFALPVSTLVTVS